MVLGREKVENDLRKTLGMRTPGQHTCAYTYTRHNKALTAIKKKPSMSFLSSRLKLPLEINLAGCCTQGSWELSPGQDKQALASRHAIAN